MITEFIADGRSIKQPKIVQFSASVRDHTLLLDDRGRVYTFGLSYGGKLGHGRPVLERNVERMDG